MHAVQDTIRMPSSTALVYAEVRLRRHPDGDRWMYGFSFGTGSEGLGFAALPKWARNRSTRDDALHAGLAELREALPTRNDPEGATRIRNWVNSTLQSLQQPSLFG